jgi:hypothetical protein
MISVHHARYYAYELTRVGGEGVDRLSQSLFDACVDLSAADLVGDAGDTVRPRCSYDLFSPELCCPKTTRCWNAHNSL